MQLCSQETPIESRITASFTSLGTQVSNSLFPVRRFHHIKSPKKRKHIADWSRELRIGGFAKVGYPGVIVAEGLQPDVEDFVARLRSQQWKAMAVRGEHTVRCPTQAEAEGKRHFAAGKVGELADGQLGVLGEHCRAAGLEGLFLTALKIDKG